VKKTIVLVVTLLLFSLAPLFSKVEFTLMPKSPLFRGYLADPYGPSSKFHLLFAQTQASIPTSALIVQGGQYEEIPFTNEPQSSFYSLKAGANVGLLRLKVDFFQVEAFISGGLHTAFELHGDSDSLGYDGFYSFGINIMLWDIVTLKGGLHHFSGHWGDEMLLNLAQVNPTLEFWETTFLEYTRDNSWLLSIAIEPLSLLRLYSTIEIPMINAFVRPGAHTPFRNHYPGQSETNFHTYITAGEGTTTTIVYPPSYRALRIQTGAEVKVPLFSIGSLFLAGDFQFHQDGQTLHQINGYNKANRWEFTFSVGGGFEFNIDQVEPKTRLEIYYLNGRFPMLNYFTQRGHYLTVGIAIGG
jgi:hypothetical protein